MAKLEIGSITVIVKGFFSNNGLPYFQKSIPKALQPRFGKAAVKVRLHERDGNFLVQCHRLNEQFASLFRAMKDDPTITPSQTKASALALLQAAGLKPGSGLHDERIRLSDGRTETFNVSEVLHDFLMDGDFEPSAVTDAAFGALRGQLPVLLSEAFTVYLDNHQKSKDKSFVESQRQHWQKLVNLLGDKPLTSVTRDDAKRYRDHRLGAGAAPTTVKREINVIRAVFAKALRELSLAIPNQFSALEIPKTSRPANERLPYTPEEITLLVNEAIRANDEQRRIVLVLAFTGARLAEIVGLRTQDVDLDKRCIYIRPHPGRALKTEQSRREVPLLPVAYEALKAQLLSSRGGAVFPAYATREETRTDSASATLNKWARRLVPERTMHCFRHSLRDRLRAVMCPESVSKEIGGWSNTHDISVHYGQGYPMDVKREWLTKAYEAVVSQLMA